MTQRLIARPRDCGTLYLVATPIGNLEDMTFRAVSVLSSVDLVLAEDTRHSRKLLAHYSIHTPMQAFHEHNEKQLCEELSRQLLNGRNLALISDAGTPLISDPGYALVSRLKSEGLPVVPVPGACAPIVALSASGLPTDRFVFEGFLPTKTAALRNRLASFVNETRTSLFLESCHRIEGTLREMASVFGGDRLICLARELTKKFEVIHRASIDKITNRLEEDPVEKKGEMVVIVSGLAAQADDAQGRDLEKVLRPLLDELPLKQAVRIAVSITHQKKNEVYSRAVAMKERSG